LRGGGEALKEMALHWGEGGLGRAFTKTSKNGRASGPRSRGQGNLKIQRSVQRRGRGNTKRSTKEAKEGGGLLGSL